MPFLAEAAVVATAKAIEAFFVFLATPEGQQTVKQWRENDERVRGEIRAFFGRVETIFKDKD